MISKQEVMSLMWDEGMKIAVTIVLKNQKTIEFVREDDNERSGLLHEYLFNETVLDEIFEKATDGCGILEGLKSINEYFMYWDLTDKEIEQLDEQFNNIHSISDVVKIVIQEAIAYGSEPDYQKYEYCYSSFNYSFADYIIEDGVLKKGPKKGEISIPEGTKRIADSAFFAVEYGMPKGQLTSVIIPEGVTRIGSKAFCGQSKLKKVHFPSTIVSIGALAFEDCVRLSDIEGLTEDTIVEGRAFCNCNSLANENGLIIVNGVLFARPVKRTKRIEIPSSVKRIDDWAFLGCDYIESVLFPDKMPKIGTGRSCDSDAFKGCKGLADEDGFVIVDGCLYDYYGDKKEIRIPDGVRSIRGESILYCDGIWRNKDVSLTVPASVVEYGEKALAGVINVKFEGDPPYTQGTLGLFGLVQDTLYRTGVPENCIVGTGATKIASEAIDAGNRDKKVIIADGVKKIGTPLCMSNGGMIKDFYFPDSIEEINGPLIDKSKSKRKLVIHASPGSYGEKYAEEYGYDFKPIKNKK